MKKRFVNSIASVTIVVAIVLMLGASAALSAPGGAPQQGAASASPATSMTLESAFAVQNLEDAEANVVISFYNTDGSLAATISAQIGRLGLGNFPMPSTLPAGWKGSVVVSSSTQVTAIGNLSTSTGASPYAIGSFDGFVPGSSGYTGETGTTMYLPFLLRERSGRSTTFGVQNAGSATASVTITYYNTDGSVRSAIDRSLAAGQADIHQQAVDDTGFLPAGWMGSVVATSSQPLAAVVFDVGDGVIYSYNGIPNPSTTLYLPFLARNRSDQNTAFYIQNTSSSQATISVRYVGSTPSGAVDLTDTVTRDGKQGWNQGQASVAGLPDGFLGSATVTSSQPLVGIVNHFYGNPSLPGKKASYVAFSRGSRTVALPFVLRTRGSRSQGIIVQNVGGSLTNVTFTFTPLGAGNGSSTSKTVSVGAGGFWNFGTDWSDFSSMGEGSYGSATLTSDNSDIVAIVNTAQSPAPYGDSLGSYNGINR